MSLSRASTSITSVGQDASRPTSVKAGEKQYRSEMLFIGAICHWSDCHRESFLPIRCPDCHQQFCSDHYKTGDHHCAQASATFLVPLCPLCHEPPKNWKRDEDPNIAMNSHLSPHSRTGKIECEAVDGQGMVRDDAKGRQHQQRREKKENECNEKKCRKLMIVPIKCPSCSLQFCPSHRAPVQHSCQSLQVKSASPSYSSSKIKSKSRLLDVVSSKSPTVDHNSKQKEAENKKLNPLQAIGAAHKGITTDKRARLEHQSAIKAMQNRHAKGLLTPAEEVVLAKEMALMQERKSSGQDCVVL